jgi:hypothetical protein
MSVQAENSRSCPILSSLGYNGSLVTWTVVRLIATKFKPLVFSVPVFALSNISNICIFMILYDFCLLPANTLSMHLTVLEVAPELLHDANIS